MWRTGRGFGRRLVDHTAKHRGRRIQTEPLPPRANSRQCFSAWGRLSHRYAHKATRRCNHAHRHRVQDRRRRDPARLALPARRGQRPVRHDRDGARLLGGEGDVPRPLRRGLRRAPGWRRSCSTTATSARATASRARRSTPGSRSATIAMRSAFALTLPETDARPDRRLGLELFGRPCAGARRDRPPHPLRRLAGAADQRLSQRAPADPRRHDRPGRCGVRRRPAEALPGRAAGAAAGGRRRTRRGRPRCRRPTAGSGSPRPARTRAPSWRNEVTLRSVELFMGYEPGA